MRSVSLFSCKALINASISSAAFLRLHAQKYFLFFTLSLRIGTVRLVTTIAFREAQSANRAISIMEHRQFQFRKRVWSKNTSTPL